MMPAPNTENPIETFGDIACAADATELCETIARAMDSLIDTIEDETALVRAGKVLEAGALQPKKAGLSDVYVKAILYARRQGEALKRYAPEAADLLERRHTEFRSLLRINMAVLATARQVSEELVQNVSRNVGKADRPSTYAASGVAQSGPSSPIPGIAYDRTG